jgi:photosystem II stability/assembly factor-like uncharacterized protein
MTKRMPPAKLHLGFLSMNVSVNLVGLLVLLLALTVGPASAADEFRVLHENAITVSRPDHVLLISITKAGRRLVAVGEHGVILYSDDNGKTWRQSVVPVRVSITCVAFATPLEGWAAGAYGIILHTADGGQTWQTQIDGTQVNQLMMAAAQSFNTANLAAPGAATALRRANIFMQAGPDKPFLTILAISPEKAIVFGAYRMALSTNDGGKHWQDISLQIGDPVSHNIYGATIFGSTIYLAVETGSVFRSTDGGASFAQVMPPNGATFFGILSSAKGDLIAYGVAGTLFRSSDAGSNWTQINLGTSANLTAGRLLKGGQIVIISERGDVYISQDDGVTFQAVSANFGMELYDLEQAADGDVVFVGNDGVRVIPASIFSGFK